MSTGKDNAGVEKLKFRWGGDSRDMRFPLKAAVGRLKRICMMLNVAEVAVDVQASGCAVLL